MRIIELQTKRGLFKAQLAKKLVVSVRTIFRWEKDVMSMTLKNAVEVTKFFDISLDRLVK